LRNELRRIFQLRPAEALGELQALDLMAAMGLPHAREQACARSRELPAAGRALGLSDEELQPLVACLGLYAAEAGVEPLQLGERLMLAADERSGLTDAIRLLSDPPPALQAGAASELYFALEGTPAAAIAAVWTTLDEAGHARLEHYWRELRPVQADITGNDLIAAGHSPGPQFGPALRAALAAKLDRGADREEQLRVALAQLTGGDEG